MQFQCSGVITINNPNSIIDFIKNLFEFTYVKVNHTGVELSFESEKIELFITSYDDRQFDIDISGISETEIQSIAYQISEFCQKENAQGYIVTFNQDTPELETETFSN